MSHEKYTTPAFVLKSYEQGENDLTYKIFTRDFGIVFAKAQSIRKVTSKLRMKIKVNDYCIITLVKGKEVWRITGVEEDLKEEGFSILRKKILALYSEVVSRFLPTEKPHKKLFDKLKEISYLKYVDFANIKMLIYFIVLVDTGYADAKVIGVNDLEEYKKLSADDLYTHLILNEKEIKKYLILALKNIML